jgi:hypothetical protein
MDGPRDPARRQSRTLSGHLGDLATIPAFSCTSGDFACYIAIGR